MLTISRSLSAPMRQLRSQMRYDVVIIVNQTEKKVLCVH